MQYLRALGQNTLPFVHYPVFKRLNTSHTVSRGSGTVVTCTARARTQPHTTACQRPNTPSSHQSLALRHCGNREAEVPPRSFTHKEPSNPFPFSQGTGEASSAIGNGKRRNEPSQELCSASAKYQEYLRRGIIRPLWHDTDMPATLDWSPKRRLRFKQPAGIGATPTRVKIE